METKTCVITGASGGIGRATAIALANRGWYVVLLARRQAELDSVLAECSGSGRAIVCDVGDAKSVDAAVASVIANEKRCDVLVNNAGVSSKTQITDDSWIPTFERLLRVNLIGAAQMTVGLLPLLQSSQSGTVINISSVAGRIATPNDPAYCSTKFALTGLTEAMSAAMRSDGIRFVNIQPGPIVTPGWPHDYLQRSWIMRRFAPDADRVARTVIRAIRRPRRVNRYVPAYWRAVVVLAQLFTELTNRVVQPIKSL